MHGKKIGVSGVKMESTKKTNKVLGFLKLALSFMIVSPLFINAQEIEEVVVSGSFIPDEKRDTSEISAVLDSSEIERTGDYNIAIDQ